MKNSLRHLQFAEFDLSSLSMKTNFKARIRGNSLVEPAGASSADGGRPAQRRMQSGARAIGRTLLMGAVSLLCGCQELTYTGPSGERFSRRCLGTSTSVGRLSIETATNGVRRVQLEGYHNDGTQSLGVVTEAAVRAAIQGAIK
jgi:hypothetical protein